MYITDAIDQILKNKVYADELKKYIELSDKKSKQILSEDIRNGRGYFMSCTSGESYGFNHGILKDEFYNTKDEVGLYEELKIKLDKISK